MPEGCQITIVSDSCHSGGLIDEAKEQIGESTKQNKEQSSDSGFGFKTFLRRNVEDAIESRGIHIPSKFKVGHHGRQHHQEDEEIDDDYQGEGYMINKSLPLSTLIEILKQKTGKDDIDVGKLRPTLFDIFGDDASPKVKKFMKVILDKLRSHGEDGSGSLLGLVGGLAQQFLQHKFEENDADYAKPAMQTHMGSKQEVYAGANTKDYQIVVFLIVAARRLLMLQRLVAYLTGL